MDSKTSDIFCKLSFDGQECKTKTHKACLSAEISETFLLEANFDYMELVP